MASLDSHVGSYSIIIKQAVSKYVVSLGKIKRYDPYGWPRLRHSAALVLYSGEQVWEGRGSAGR